MVYATRKFTFSAGHRYWRPEWSAEENARVFGSLTVAHGHNYGLEVTVRCEGEDITPPNPRAFADPDGGAP